MNKKLYRSVTDKMLGGVCGGIAEYFGIDPVIIRLTFVLAVIFGGSGILAYIILWIIIPQKPYIVTPFNQENKNDDNLHNAETENKTSDDLQSNKFRKNLNNNKTVFAGIFLIVLGVIILLSNFIPGFYFKDYWPVVLIFLGSAIIYKAKNNKTNEVI
ncbi:MAG: PspC domain-containing protein [Ignavibacterium sp.]|nr:PspC domain-containing protein [Ignavibacterium sp.]